MSIAYSVATEHFRIEQLEGEECALCGVPFKPGQELRPVWLDSDFDLYAHEQCPEQTGAKR